MIRHLGTLALGLVLLTSTGCKDLIDGIGDDTQSCQASSECSGGEVCSAGVCRPPGQAGLQDPCWASRDCSAGLYCSPLGTCQMAGTGMAGALCSTDGDCAPGLRCELAGLQGTCTAAGGGEPGATCSKNDDCLGGLYCGVDKTCKPLVQAFPPFAGVECLPAEGAFRPYFELVRPGAPPKDFYRLPFPNDARVSQNGILDMSDFPKPGPTPLGIDLAQLYVDALVADFEGFGANSVVTFRFAGELDFDSVEDHVQLLDVTPGPTQGQSFGLNYSYSSGRNKYVCENRFSVRADIRSPLSPKHTYAVVLMSGIKAKGGGAAAVRDADFDAVMAQTRPADATLGAAWDRYQPLRTTLTAKGTDPATVIGAAVFTVQDTTGHMQRLAQSVAAQPVPTLSAVTVCDTGVTSPCDDGTPARACPAANPDYYEIHAKLAVPIYQAGTAPYLTPGDGGGIVETAGVPQIVRNEDVCVALTIPKGAAPVGGWPLVVYHHGTGGSMRSFIGEGIGAALAKASTPIAGLGFDAVEHGARRGGSSESPDNLVFNVLNPRAARDNFLQGAADVLVMLRVGEIAPLAVTGVGTVDFDATKVSFFGHSQGATSGEIALAFADGAGAAVLSGTGAFLTSSLLEKTSPVNIKAGMQLLFGEPGQSFNGEHPIMTLFQTYFERSDPVNYAPLIVRRPPLGVRSKHVLMVYGTADTFTPRGVQQHNARGLGVPPLGAVISGEDYDIPPIIGPATLNVSAGDGQKRTAVCVQYAPSSGYDGHFVAQREPTAVSDWVGFLASYFATANPVVD